MAEDPLHPSRALFAGATPPPLLSACDHYAGTEERMRKALALQATRGADFDVTLDLEDGAPTGREADHAELVVSLLRDETLNRHRRAGVRIHDPGHPAHRADIVAVVAGAGAVVSHLTIPKIVSARQLADTITALQRACADQGLRREIPLHVLIETPFAVRDVFKIAALPWLVGLDFGTMDFVSAHHGAIGASAMRSPMQFDHALMRYAKTLQVAAALAHGLVPAHGVTLAARDAAQTREDAERARREFGYLRMWSIHPAQIDPILAAFAPDVAGLTLAGAVLLAGRAAAWAPVSLDGVLYDRASYRYYWRQVAQAHQTGAALSPEVQAAFFP